MDHEGGRSTPATDGQFVYTIGPFGQIRAVRFSDGAFVWQRDLLKDWGARKPGYSVSTSPMLYGNWVIVTPWGRQASVVALDKATGRTVWETPNRHNLAEDYQSPVGMTLGRPGHDPGARAAGLYAGR